MASLSGHAQPHALTIACWLGGLGWLGSWRRIFSLKPPSSPGLRHLADPPALRQAWPSAVIHTHQSTIPALNWGPLAGHRASASSLTVVACSVPGPPVLHNTVEENTYVKDQDPVSLVPLPSNLTRQDHNTTPPLVVRLAPLVHKVDRSSAPRDNPSSPSHPSHCMFDSPTRVVNLTYQQTLRPIPQQPLFSSTRC